jgi:hypothetical protein
MKTGYHNELEGLAPTDNGPPHRTRLDPPTPTSSSARGTPRQEHRLTTTPSQSDLLVPSCYEGSHPLGRWCEPAETLKCGALRTRHASPRVGTLARRKDPPDSARRRGGTSDERSPIKSKDIIS